MANYEYLQEIEKYGRENKIPILLDDSLEFIEDILNEKKPKRILEIGTAIGFSAICFSKFLAEDGRIDTIEIESLRVEQAIENIKKVGVQDKIRVLEGDALDVLPYLQEFQYHHWHQIPLIYYILKILYLAYLKHYYSFPMIYDYSILKYLKVIANFDLLIQYNPDLESNM